MNNHKFDVNNLSLDEKIGQLLMFGFVGETVDQKTIDFIKTYKAGNVILFTRNIKSGEQLYNLNKQLQKEALKHLDIPMFIGIDQEGGMLSRIQQGTTFFPGAMTISANGSLDDCYQIGDMMGKELKHLGVNMNFAPVLDINNNPKILLADEPTGALDSETSEQIMKLIEKISKDRLVIMVTHNSEIAEAHSDRIVHLLDGLVTADSRPSEPVKKEREQKLENKKTAMSYMTAIKTSFKN